MLLVCLGPPDGLTGKFTLLVYCRTIVLEIVEQQAKASKLAACHEPRQTNGHRDSYPALPKPVPTYITQPRRKERKQTLAMALQKLLRGTRAQASGSTAVLRSQEGRFICNF